MKIVKKLSLLAVLVMILIMSVAGVGVAAEKEGKIPPEAANPQLKSRFVDVAATDNNALFINYLADRKIITGYPDGTYHPQEGLTRAQAAIVLVKAANLSASSSAVNDTGFTDVKAEHWAAASIAAAAKAGYLKGYPDGSFHPDEKLTRAQGVALVMRLSTQQERPALPVLKDLDQSHWAAGDVALALAAGMIGLTNENSQVNPDAAMNRGSLARALGTLLTKDPGLYLQKMAGTIKDVKGEVKLTRQGAGSLLKNDDQVYAGDAINSTANSSASIYYPDGSSVLIKENTEIVIKESMGRDCIKSDGSSGVAVDNVDFDLKKGTLFGALATKHETEEKQQAQAGEKLLAGLEGLGYIADNSKSKAPPWYQQAEAKKVKMKVDMPYGVASVRGTFILVSVLSDGTATVGCLTGDAGVEGSSGKYVALTAGLSSAVNQGGTTTNAAPLTDKEKQEFHAAQQWVVNTALGIDINKEGTVPPVAEMLIEIPDQTLTPAQQAQSLKNTIEVVLNALESSGITLTEQVKKELEEKLKEIQSEKSQKVLDALQSNNNQNNTPNNSQTGGGSGGTEEGSSVAYVNYVAAGTYGPETPANPQTISKNVIVGASGVMLQNMVIKKDLILAASIEDGSVTLKNVKVQGNTFVLGGGPNSVVLEDCELYTVTVDKETNTVRIVAKGNTAIGALTLNSGAKLEESGVSGPGFSSVTTGPSIPKGAKVILSGNFAAVNIEAPELNIEVAGGTIGEINLSSAASDVALNLGAGVSVSSLQINAPIDIKGSGQIVSAVINAEGVKMATPPLKWTITGDFPATIGDQSVTGSGGANIVSTNAKLASLSLSSGTLNPDFAPTTFNYSASVANIVYAETVSFSCQDANSSVLFNNTAAAGGKTVSLNEGENIFIIKVTAQDGSTTATYTVTITRGANSAPVANDVSISGTVQVGQTLTGQYTYSDADGDPEGASICKWYRADTETGAKTVLGSVYNSTTYTVAN
ncbi:MAG: S-layer homology domain-containing protein, partial [Syntrophomonas sp.]